MARYRTRPDGLYDVETSAGYLPVGGNDYMLRELGYELEGSPVPPLEGRLAQNFDDYDRLGRGASPARTDAGGGGSGGASGTAPAAPEEGRSGTERVERGDGTRPRSAPSHAEGYLPSSPDKRRRDAEWNAAARSESEEYSRSVPGRLAEIWNDPKRSFEDKVAASKAIAPQLSAEETIEMASQPDRFAPKTEMLEFDADEYAAEQAARGGGGQYVPGGDQRVAFQVQKAKGIDPDLLEYESDAAINQKLALQRQGEAAARRAGIMGDAADRALEMSEQHIGQEQMRLSRMRADFERKQEAIAREREAVNKLEVDPDRVFSGDSGAMMKIIAAISMIAGGVLQGLNGLGSNPAIDTLNKIIDRDIQNQKERIARRREGIDASETELDRLIQIYGNPEVAERELRQRQLALISAYARRATMDSPDDVRANVEAQLADFDARRARELMALDQELRDAVVEQWRYQPGQVVGGYTLSKADEKDLQGLGAAYQKEGIPQSEADLGESEDILKGIPPRTGEVPTDESRNVASRAARGVLDWVGGTGTGSRAFDSEAERIVKGKFLRAKAKARHAIAGASLTDSERADFEKQFETVNTPEGLSEFNRSLEMAIRRKKAAVGAGFRPQISNEYERRKKELAPRTGPKSTRSDE